MPAEMWSSVPEIAAAAFMGLVAVCWQSLRGEIDRRFAEIHERMDETAAQLGQLREAVGRLELAMERQARLSEQRFLRRNECRHQDVREAG